MAFNEYGLILSGTYSKSTCINAPVNKSLNNGHLSLFELLLGISTSGVGEVDSVTDLDVVRKGDVFYFNTTCISFHSKFRFDSSTKTCSIPRYHSSQSKTPQSRQI